MVMWMDDVREPWKHGFMGSEWVKTADEAIALLRTGSVHFASLDHDLSEMATIGQPAPGEKTGYTVILFLEEHPELWPIDGVRVHSMNPAGKAKMLQAVEAHYGMTFQHARLTST